MISREEAISQVRNIKKHLGAQKAFLFGSVARAEQHELSDVDVLFVMETTKRFHDRLIDVWDACDSHFPIEPLVYTPHEFERMKDTRALEFMLEGSVEI